jgi:hypothetical protein
MNVFADIETIPAQHPEFLADLIAKHTEAANAEACAVCPPGNYKKPEALEKWWAEEGLAKRNTILASAAGKADAEYRQTSLDGAFGQIAVIGCAIDDHDPVALWTPDYATSEATIIREFYDALTTGFVYGQARFVGHNILGFDLRFLLQRSIVNGIRPPAFIPFNAKPWEQDKVFDTMTAWAGVGGKIKLDKLCKALGLPGKPDGIDGSQVWDYVKSGRIAEVAEYCANSDVAQTRECFYRLTFADRAA